MTTNLIAAILVVLVTNTVEHWPQHVEYTKGVTTQYAVEHPWEQWSLPIPRYSDDTNADSMTVETTVTRQRLLSVPFEGRTFTETLTNEPHLHYSVEMQRVRTNVWIYIPFDEDGSFHMDGIVPLRVKMNKPWPQAEIATNYFVPVKTNALPLVTEQSVCYSTNAIMEYPFSITNYLIPNKK